ncbi:serine/threonine-protein phosphatase CPPED1-like [Amphiura filiformis]|uniref:serine/threonine-protein phosphatase CPPED1-like n=1 Tax=Amphiura filiformis TaxID=82378 RepID=UPI003B212497
MSGDPAKFVVKAKNRGFEGLDQDKEGTWQGPFCFIQAADCQYGMIDDWEEKASQGWEREIQLTRDAIAAANRMEPKPKFFVMCGDLVNAFPGEAKREEQERSFLEEFAKIDPSIPLVCVCGNHDLGNTPTRDTVQDFRDKFGDDYFSFWAGGVRFLVLNSQYYEDPSLVMELKKKQDTWLDKELAAAQSSGCKHLVVIQHIPWFLKDGEEEDDYFNINRDVRIPMLDKLHKAGVQYIFCGHYHRNAGGDYKGMQLIVTSALGCPLGEAKSGLRVVKVTEEAITHQYYAVKDIPHKVEL